MRRTNLNLLLRVLLNDLVFELLLQLVFLLLKLLIFSLFILDLPFAFFEEAPFFVNRRLIWICFGVLVHDQSEGFFLRRVEAFDVQGALLGAGVVAFADQLVDLGRVSVRGNLLVLGLGASQKHLVCWHYLR